MKMSMAGDRFSYQLMDRREQIRRYELKHRPFPPRSGSVSKSRRSLEPEPERDYFKADWEVNGIGELIECEIIDGR